VNALRGTGSIAADRREQLGIVWCPACQADTLPNERTGRCYFCGERIAEPQPAPRSNVIRFPEERLRCRCGHNAGLHDHRGRCFDCPCDLFTPAEMEP
jgi:hypothetical protein